MHLVINQPTDRIEQVTGACIDKLYNLSKSNTLDSTSYLRGSINTASAYEDAVTFLNTMWGPDLIVTAGAYYIRFADPEVVSVLIAKGVMQEGEGLTMAQADDLPTGDGSANQFWWSSNTTIKEFDEIKYFGRLKNGSYEMGQWFTNATNLESVDLTGFTKLKGFLLFSGCKNLEYFHGRNNTPNTLNLEDLTQLSAMFKGCLKLYHIASLGNIAYIPDYAFGDCTNLETVNLPSSCINLASNCFKSDSKLHTINLSHVTGIGTSAFDGCSSLEYCDGPNSTQGELNLPNLTGTLGGIAFRSCTKLTSIASLGSITTIGGNAFENCTNLATINFPNTLTSVGVNAFNGTAWYNSQPNGPVYIAKILYKCKNASGALVIPNNIVSINGEAFHDCSNLTSVTIGPDINSIDVAGGIFKGCTTLSTVVVDSNNITYDSRDNCNAIIKTSSNTLILGCKDTVIPNSITSIGDSAFLYCPNLTSITLPNSITSLGREPFAFCQSLTSITLPQYITSIPWHAMYGCSNLTSVTIPSGVTSIESAALYQCSSLSSIIIEATVPPTLGSAAFDMTNNCPIYVPAGSVSAYQSASGWSNYASRIQAIPNS